MRSTRFARLQQYAKRNAVAFLALFVALGGTGAYAANTIGSADIIDNSLISTDIKDGEVKAIDIGIGQVPGSRIVDETIKSGDIANNRVSGLDIEDNGIASLDLRDGSIASVDIKDGTIREGDAIREDFLPFGAGSGAVVTVPPGQIQYAVATCEFADDTAVGGGYKILNGEDPDPSGYVFANGPHDVDADGQVDSWIVGAKNLRDTGDLTLRAYARCVELRPDDALPATASKGAAAGRGGAEPTIDKTAAPRP